MQAVTFHGCSRYINEIDEQARSGRAKRATLLVSYIQCHILKKNINLITVGLTMTL